MVDRSNIEEKLKEASEILEALGIQLTAKNKVAPLTLLALCQIRPGDQWETAKRQSLTISKDIMPFAAQFYDISYKANTRESFRKNALHDFVGQNIAEINPDNPNLSPTSSRTHYAITPVCLNTIRKFKSKDWEIAIENFKRFNQSQKASKQAKAVLRKVKICGFKSIYNDEIELGRVNIFIGANGSGKTNLLGLLH
jgi:BsuBI/PstI restriction endonuclease HTH domain